MTDWKNLKVPADTHARLTERKATIEGGATWALLFDRLLDADETVNVDGEASVPQPTRDRFTDAQLDQLEALFDEASITAESTSDTGTETGTDTEPDSGTDTDSERPSAGFTDEDRRTLECIQELAEKLPDRAADRVVSELSNGR